MSDGVLVDMQLADLLPDATIDDCLVIAPNDEEDAVPSVAAAERVLEARGVNMDGSGGLAWAEAAEGAVVARKYRMMSAMLKDGPRNAAYAAAIEEAVRTHLARHGAPPLVLDIGTGFGLLGMVAARAGALVVGCEMNTAVAAVCERVVERNGLAARMQVLPRRSDELTPHVLDGRRFDLIVTETLDSELLREGIVPTLRHAQAVLLAPGGRIVPARAHLYCELVALDATTAPCLSTLNSEAVLEWETLAPTTASELADAVDAAGVTVYAAPLAALDAFCNPDEMHTPLRVQADALRASGALRSLAGPVKLHSIALAQAETLPERVEVRREVQVRRGKTTGTHASTL